MPVIYARVTQENHDYITRQAEQSGLSITMIIGALIGHAREAGLTVRGKGFIIDQAPAPPAGIPEQGGPPGDS